MPERDASGPARQGGRYYILLWTTGWSGRIAQLLCVRLDWNRCSAWSGKSVRLRRNPHADPTPSARHCRRWCTRSPFRWCRFSIRSTSNMTTAPSTGSSWPPRTTPTPGAPLSRGCSRTLGMPARSFTGAPMRRPSSRPLPATALRGAQRAAQGPAAAPARPGQGRRPRGVRQGLPRQVGPQEGLPGAGPGADPAMMLLEYLRPGTAPERRTEIRRQLLQYCELDTWATVQVLQVLREECRQRRRR